MLMIPKIFPETQDTLFHKNFAEKSLPVEDLLAFNASMGAVSELAKWSHGWLDKTPTERLFQEVANLSIKHLNTKYTSDSQIKCYFNTVRLYKQIKHRNKESKELFTKVCEALMKFFKANLQ